LAALGLKPWNPAASVLALLLLGCWIYRYRRADLWLLLGVTAIVARLWVYHRSYDDMLIILPMITLFRIAKSDGSKNGYDVLAGVILAISIVIMFVPALKLVAPQWESLLKNSQTVIPLTILWFLLFWGWRQDERSESQIASSIGPPPKPHQRVPFA
jgi:hypothetical protein